MSTKIYNGWRCKLAVLSQANEWLFLKCWRRATNAFRKMSGGGDWSYDQVRLLHMDSPAGFHLWTDQETGRAYFIGYGRTMSIPDKDLPPWLESYSYWNNVDHPPEISYRAWCDRGKVWDRVALNPGRWLRRSTTTVLGAEETTLYLLAELSPKYRKHYGLKVCQLLSKQPLPEV